MILGERNAEAGAYYVEFEDFKKIYRLVSRIVSDYKREVILMQITLLEEEYLDEFKEILPDSLRKSDCVTCSGKKFLILLMESTEHESEVVKNRIISRLGVKIASKTIFEHEKII